MAAPQLDPPGRARGGALEVVRPEDLRPLTAALVRLRLSADVPR